MFDLKKLISSSPQATVFQASFCFVLYNILIVMRAYLSVAVDREPETISCEKLFVDVKRQLIAFSELVGPHRARVVLGSPWTARQLQERLGGLLAGAWTNRWLKAPPRKVPKKHPEKEYLKGGHDSVYRLVQKYNENQMDENQSKE